MYNIKTICLFSCLFILIKSQDYVADDDADCALKIVRDPTKFSNDISITLGPFCISKNAVNEAFALSRNKVGLNNNQIPIEGNNNEIKLAEALIETTKIIRDRYLLTNEEVWGALPLLDTYETDIGLWCPIRLSLNQNCPQRLSRYRNVDGSCSNNGFFHGKAFQPFPRLLPPEYSDGVEKPRRSASGRPLPDARFVSAKVHKDLGYHDHAVTIMFLAWGQLIDHDLTATAESKIPGTLTEPDCCINPRINPHCAPLNIPVDDGFYKNYGARCISFLRTPPALRPGCKLGPRSQNNELTSTLDASFVYGSNSELAENLRLGAGGELASLNILPSGLKPLLPLKIAHPDDGCTRPNQNLFCFLAGDNRVNEQLMLGGLHTVLVREHNRIAEKLSSLNPHWSDETIFQETKMIVAAQVQVITYGEFLPVLLGKQLINEFDLEINEGAGFYDNHINTKDPTVPSSFATAAFRFGHSLLPSTLERWSVNHRYIASQRLSGMLKKPFDLYRPGRVDEILVGMTNQVAQAMDNAVTSEVTQQLFKKPGALFGRDLASINIARAREHGVAGYLQFRRYCGLSVARSWQQMSLNFLSNDTAFQYSKVYENVEDVDLWSAGISEKPVKGGLVGPTFACIIGKAFQNLRRADRFWFENGNHPGSFTPGQIKELRRIKLATLLCANSDNIATLQNYVMLLPDPNINRRVSCNLIPKLDLNAWIDKSRIN